MEYSGAGRVMLTAYSQKSHGLSLSRIANAAGVQRYVVSVLIEAHRIPCIKLCNHKIVGWDALPDLIEILKGYPGVRPDFADDLRDHMHAVD